MRSLRFGVYEYVKPTMETLVKGLEGVTRNETVVRNMYGYYEGDLGKINHLFGGEDPVGFFLREFEEEFAGLAEIAREGEGVVEVVERLCRKGRYKEKGREEEGEGEMGYWGWGSVIVAKEEGRWYWSSNKALFAYQMWRDVECVVPRRFAEPREVVEIPELDMVHAMFTKGREEGEEGEEGEEVVAK